MARRNVSRNAPCPCGSGKKYKHCCLRKGFEWLEDDDGGIFKSVPISDEMKALLDEQRLSFIAEHGREPGPEETVFHDLPHFEHLEHQIVERMKELGIDPAIVYATEQTGRIVSEDNMHLLSDIELAEWEAAVEEYRSEHGSQEPLEYPIGTVALYGPDDKTTTKIVAGVI
ncbi:MAG: SEC-C domain-containing protein, partial [Planctomycetia bacterium]|nr:SEC-C domain-containing protein [Planctomycetia bacterium]